MQEVPIPAALGERITSYRDQLIESAVESDDEIMEKFLDGKELSDAEIISVVKKGIGSGALVPVLCAAASKNIGIQTLLDSVVDYLPSAASATPDDTKAFDSAVSLFVFKTTSAQAGTISTFRVYSGALKADSHLYNMETTADERLGQLHIPHGKTQESATEISAGDFGVVAKLSIRIQAIR